MSDMARKARLALKAKAKSLAGEKDQKVDSSDWKQAEPLNADVKTGARPVSRRAFKKGGKVTGEKAKMNIGRKPRKAGGATPQAYANAKINRNVKDANEEREGKKHVGGFKKGGRARREEGGQVEQYDREALKRLIEREGGSDRLMPKGKGVKTREVEAFDLYDPEQLKRLERGYKKGGRAKKKIGGALEFLSPVAMLANAMRDDDDDKGKKRGGRAKRKDGGSTGMRSESTEYAKKSRAADEEYRNAQEKYFKGGLKDWEESGGYEDKHGQYHSRKKGGRAKKQAGGPMMMDPRLGMVSSDALPGFNQLTPGKKKGGKVKAGASFDEMRSKFGTQVMQKGGKAGHSDEAMDKALIKKMVKKSARTGKANGGGMRSERTELAKSTRNVLDRSKDFNEFEAKHGNAFRAGDKRASEYADKAAKYGAAQGAHDKTLSETGGMKKGGRAKRASGGRQSFNSAFAEARKNGMDLFEWNGKTYNTKLADGAPAAKKAAPKPTSSSSDRAQSTYGDLTGSDSTPSASSTYGDVMGGDESRTTVVPPKKDEPSSRFHRETPLQGWGSRYKGWSNKEEAPAAKADKTYDQLKRGGRAKKQSGGSLRAYQAALDEYLATPKAERKDARGKLSEAFSTYNESVAADKTRPQAARDLANMRLGKEKGGRAKRAAGGMIGGDEGHAKSKKGSGKTNINIIIAAGKPADQQQMQQPQAAPPPAGMVPPPPPPQGGMPMGGAPMGAPPMPPPEAMGGMAPPPMPRKSGGRAGYRTGGAPAGMGKPAMPTTTTATRPQGAMPPAGMGKPAMGRPVMGNLGTSTAVGAAQPAPGIRQSAMMSAQGMGKPAVGGGLGAMVQPGMMPPPAQGMGRQLGAMLPQGMGKPAMAPSPAPNPQLEAQYAAMMQQQGAGARQPGAMPPAPVFRKSGGRISKAAKSYQDMEAGAGSGEGRLQKTDIAKRQAKPGFSKGENVYEGRGYPNKVLGATGGRTARKSGGKTYSSFKDMDAGAGSGEGRLEKTEIQKKKR